MPYNGPLDIQPFSEVVYGWMSTYVADLPRANKHDSDVQVSPAELELVLALRAAEVTGWEQQVPVGPFYVDFVFHERFGVEVDGAAYHTDRQREQERDAYLLGHGLTEVWHFRALEIFSDVDRIVIEILRLIARGTAGQGDQSCA